jgi:hypothetical protein
MYYYVSVRCTLFLILDSKATNIIGALHLTLSFITVLLFLLSQRQRREMFVAVN